MRFLLIIFFFRPFVSLALEVQPNNNPTVITTFSVLYDLTQWIAKDKVNIINLTPKSADLHVYEPNLKVITQAQSAQVLFANGGNLEPWLNRVLNRLPPKIKIIYVAQPLIKNGDPHAWNNPELLLKYIDTITQELSKLEPNYKSLFEENAQLLKEQVSSLDEKYQKLFSLVPKEKRILFTTHESANYLAQRYQIEIVSAPGFFSSQDIKTKNLADIIRQIQTRKIKKIFSEPHHQQIFVEKLAHSTGVKIGEPLYLDGLSLENKPASTVIKMLEYNLSTIYDSMKNSSL